MSETRKAGVPHTAGDLRRLIAEKELTWKVDPRLRDGDRLPTYARGGQLDAHEAFEAAEVKNVSEYLTEQTPPSNPFMQERWVELKLMSPEQRNDTAGSPLTPPAPMVHARHTPSNGE